MTRSKLATGRKRSSVAGGRAAGLLRSNTISATFFIRPFRADRRELRRAMPGRARLDGLQAMRAATLLQLAATPRLVDLM
ncbi:hypothetical protein [Burkholderia glumae]|uniref:hypothetical protein n=1 Tax=Burkholderia glumae TaxID=337 RepID=UPI0012F8D4A0|nr:hypothetical protein [Burkholderia glumae]